MMPCTAGSALSAASSVPIRSGAAVSPRWTTEQAMPVFSAAREMERTYQALDSSAVATTTASRGSVPAVAVSSAAVAAASARMPAARSFPLRSRVTAPVRPGRRR
jgi:hypothetical protein